VTEFDCVIVGGGPAGATAATELARAGRHVLLLDRGGRIKPCGGAIPPRLIRDFAIPESIIVGRAVSARMIAPSDAAVDMAVDPAGGGDFVGMVDRESFDAWLRDRAASAGAHRATGTFDRLERDAEGPQSSSITASVTDPSSAFARARSWVRTVRGRGWRVRRCPKPTSPACSPITK
jgi:flavin-dependent dehydrogenase